jgi:hypothetical protein
MLDFSSLMMDMNSFPQRSAHAPPSAPDIAQTGASSGISRLLHSYYRNTSNMQPSSNFLQNFDTISTNSLFSSFRDVLQQPSPHSTGSTSQQTYQVHQQSPFQVMRQFTYLELPPILPTNPSSEGDGGAPTNSIHYHSYNSGFADRNSTSPFYNLASMTLDILASINDIVYDDYDENIRLAERLGVVEVGIDDINKVSSLISHDQVSDEDLCAICFDKMRCKQDEQPRLLICGHTYCDSCITQWLSKSKKCPVCNLDLEDKLNGLEHSHGP